MEDSTVLLLAFAGAIASIPLLAWVSRALQNFVQAEESRANSVLLQQIFQDVWTGDPDDVVYAWYRVKRHLENYYPFGDHRDELLMEVELNIWRCNSKIRSQKHSVDSKGRLIETTITKNRATEL